MKNIIFFDSQCNLCNRFVNFVFKKDSKRLFFYAPLQGTTALKYLNSEDIKTLKSLIFFQEGQIFKETQALKLIMKKLYPNIAFMFVIFPPVVFNLFYRFIAKYRYNWFGKRNQVYQIDEKQKPYFLP